MYPSSSSSSGLLNSSLHASDDLTCLTSRVASPSHYVTGSGSFSSGSLSSVPSFSSWDVEMVSIIIFPLSFNMYFWTFEPPSCHLPANIMSPCFQTPCSPVTVRTIKPIKWTVCNKRISICGTILRLWKRKIWCLKHNATCFGNVY